MKTFQITIKLSDGNEIHARVLADTRKEAIDRLTETEQFKEFVGDKQVEDIEATELKQPTPRPYPVADSSPFFVKETSVSGRYMCYDPSTHLLLYWTKGDFNGSQTTNSSFCTTQEPQKIDTTLREMTDFLQQYYKDLL